MFDKTLNKLPIPEWLRRVLTSPSGELTRWQFAVRWSIDLTRHCAGELRHDKAGQMAAALTYHTLFSMLPTIALALVALNMFVGPSERNDFKDKMIDWTVEVLRGGAQVSQAISPPTTTEKQAEFNDVRERLDEQFSSVLGKLEHISFGSIGVVGVLVFIYGATGLLATVERSFNSVFGVMGGRKWYIRLPLYYTVITLGPIVLLAGQWMQNRFIDLLSYASWTNWLVGPAVVAAPIVTTWLVIFLMYILLPTAAVGKRAAAIGSFVAAVLLVGGREGFRIYVSKAGVSSLYGAMALLPLFLMLLWLMWLMVLFGLELTYALGAMKGRNFKSQRHRTPQEQFIDTTWMVPVLARIAADFNNGKACSAEALAIDLRLPGRAVTKLLEALAAAELIHATGADLKTGYTLSRPADRIPLPAILDVGYNLLANGESASGNPGWKYVQQLHEADKAKAEGKTLADLM
ncbi:MAG: YihY family inner membrane protein [Planctomycetes bacterium]|nr:YihY family inner membrane protein [Planctomycetota bacterium]